MRAQQKCQKHQARYGGLTDADGKFNGTVRFMEADLDKPLRTKKPTVWAVWNDLFHARVSVGEIYHAFDVMDQCRQHTFLVLTKRPGYISETLYEPSGVKGPGYFSQKNFLPNVWLGTTCGHPESLWRVEELLKCPAAKRFVSAEPLLGELDLTWIGKSSHYEYSRWNALTGEAHAVAEGTEIPWDTIYPVGSGPICWLIIGPETGSKRRDCKEEWIESLIGQADNVGIPVFIKAFPINGRVSKDMAEWPQWARRREFPTMTQESD